MSKEKVYCRDCRHLVAFCEADTGRIVEYWCVHRNNWKDNWLQPHVLRDKKPEQKNKSNDCPDFEAKE